MDLYYNIPNYEIEILKISNSVYQLKVLHKKTSQAKEYRIDKEIKRVDFDDLRVVFNITFDDKEYLYLNFESESIIVGGFFEEHTEEHISPFMCHDFMEEGNEII